MSDNGWKQNLFIGPQPPKNYVTISVGDYETTCPLPDDTDEALSLLTPLNWSELGSRLMRLQRAAPRPQGG